MIVRQVLATSLILTGSIACMASESQTSASALNQTLAETHVLIEEVQVLVERLEIQSR